ncbi:jg20739 [Pararge aegeria aegeria]|uniref:Jg20739 protein n=1 Tax=Pararge aegeria aegeria TaxID=348720 RepID=A0A8S4RRP7_9NEOP|nr:jg20739 [Pararge aegeria aegeria]
MLVYKTTIKPIWTYGIQLWGTASNSNIDILERFQTKALRTMFGIPHCISNRYIYFDFGLKTVRQEITQHSLKYQEKLTVHVNKLAHALSGEDALQYTRLKRSDIPSLHKRFTT